MATIREIRARFTAEAKGLDGTFKGIVGGLRDLSRESNRTTQNVNRDFSSMQNTMSDVERALNDVGDVNGFGELRQSIEQAQSSLSQTGEIGEAQMQEIRRAIDRARDNFENLGSDGRQSLVVLGQSINRLDSDIRVLGGNSNLGDLESDLRDVNDELRETSDGARDASDSVGEIGNDRNRSGLGGIGEGVGKIKVGAVALVGAFAAAGAAVVGFLAQNDKLQKAYNTLETQTGATREEMEGMEDSLKNIYRNNFGESFEDIALSMANVHQATSLTGDELEKMTETALLMRDTFGYEVEESVKAADTMMKNFGITSDQAYTLMAQGAQEGADKGGELLDTINEYSPQFKAVGFDAEYMMDILIQGAKDGAFSIDKVGDAVKEMNIRMKDGNEETGEALTSLGLNATDVRKRFAEGGEAGRKAFFEVTNALEKVEDPLKRNSYGVAIMGTQYEDLEAEGVSALSALEGHTDMAGDTLQQLNEIKYNSIGEAISGIGRILVTDLLLPVQEKIMPMLNAAIGNVRDGIEEALVRIQPFKQYLEGIFALFDGNKGKAASILTRLGLSPEQIAQLSAVIQQVKDYATTTLAVWKRVFEGIRAVVVSVIGFLAPYIMPAITAVFGFVKSQLDIMRKFWDENGQQITQAVKNAFTIIKGIIDFIMPAVLFIIQTVWGNIKGVIKGALNIIMGAIKIFAGLFTGDIKKMWEGVKQLFKGAIEFVWNLINLLLVGRILKGIAGFIKAGVAAFKSFWTKTLDIFKNLDKSVGSVVNKMIGFLKNSWTRAKNEATNIFSAMKKTITNTFDDIISGAKALPGKIGSGIKSMAGKAADGAISMVNRILRGWGKGANGLIGGINWVMGKIGVNKEIPKWDVPQYAKGTDKKGHPGGLAIVGEQGRELAYIPGVGPMMVGVKGEEMLNLPKGTSVLPNKETESLVNAGMIPGYATGVGDFLKSAGSKVVSTVKKGAAGVGDFFSNLANGAKSLISKVWDNFLEFPSMSGIAKDIAFGAIKKVKSAATDYLNKKLDGFMSFGGGGSAGGKGWGSPFVKTSNFNPAGRVHPITGQVRSHNGDDWSAPAGTPIPAQGGGVVTYSGWMGGYGNIVITKAGDLERRYGHNSRNLVQVGQMVKPGQTIALVGSTGDSTGPHVHYEVRRNGYPINPSGYARGGFINKEHMAMVGEGNREEVVIPLQDHRDRAVGLWQQAGKKLGLSSDSIAVLYNEQEKVVNFLKGLIEQAKTQIREVANQSPILYAINDSVNLAKDVVNQAVTDVKTGLSTKMDESDQAIKSKMEQSDQSTLAKIASTAKETASIVVSTVKATEARLTSVVNNVGTKVAQATQTAIAKAQSAATASAKKASSTLSPIQRKVNELIKKGGSAASKYFAAVREDGDWLNDWASHISGSKKGQKPYLLAGYEYARSLGHSLGKYASQHLARVKAYAKGGLAEFPQLAMLAEGGYSESIISHDPAFKNRSREIWNKTGNMLGFKDEKGVTAGINREFIEAIYSVRDAVEAGQIIKMNDRAVAEVLKPALDRVGTTKNKLTGRSRGDVSRR